MERTFINLTTRMIVDFINSAGSRVMYASPGLDRNIARSLISAAYRIGTDNVIVLLDVAENVCRFGYGDVDGMSLLRKNEITIRQVDGLRIGTLICDNNGWIFTPTPLLIETEKDDINQPNAIRLSPDQIKSIMHTVAKENGIGNILFNDNKLDSIKKSLEINPPLSFDIARQVRVFNSAIEFVEIKLQGCEIQRHTVKIPPELLVGEIDRQTARRLKAGFKIIENNSKLSGHYLRRRVKYLRDRYTREIQRYGRTLLKTKKEQFIDEIESIRYKIKEFQEEIKNKLKKEIEESKVRLINILTPIVNNNPPKELLGQIPNDKPTDKQIEMYLKSEMEKIFPSEEVIITEMSLVYITKGVTYETVRDEAFQKQVQKAYPLIEWKKLFEEFGAMGESEGMDSDI